MVLKTNLEPFREPLKVPPVGQPKNHFFLRVYYISFPVHFQAFPFNFLNFLIIFVPRSLECAMLISVSSLIDKFCIQSSKFVYTNYRQLHFKFVRHSRWTHYNDSNSVFLHSFSSKFHSNSSTSICLVHATRRIWMNIDWNWLHKDEIDVQRNVRYMYVGRIWLQYENIEWTKLKLNYRQLQFKFVRHSRWTYYNESYSVSLHSFSSKIHSNSSTSICLVHASRRIWMNIDWNWLHKDEIDVQWNVRYMYVGRIWLQYENIEWTKLKLNYRQLQFKFVRHSRWTHYIESHSVFLHSFSSKFHSNSSTSIMPCPCQPTNLNEHWLKLIAQRRNWCAAKCQVRAWDEFDYNMKTLNGKSWHLVDTWRIWMTNDLEVFAFQPYHRIKLKLTNTNWNRTSLKMNLS